MPSSTKNGSSPRDPEMQSTQKGRNWYFGMKAHVGVDAKSGLVHTVIGTAANVHDINVAHALLHGEETSVYADVGYQGIEKREQAGTTRWHVAMRPSKRRKLNLNDPVDAIYNKIRTTEGWYPGEGRASFSNPQATIWLSEDPIPRAGEEYRSNHHIICLGNLWMMRRALANRREAAHDELGLRTLAASQDPWMVSIW